MFKTSCCQTLQSVYIYSSLSLDLAGRTVPGTACLCVGVGKVGGGERQGQIR